MIQSPLYMRIVEQDRDRGYMLMVGYEPKLVQATCATYSTLSDVSRASLDATIERMKLTYNASDIKDMTAPGLMRKLQKMFGEPVTPKE